MTWIVTYDGKIVGTVIAATWPVACRAADEKFGRTFTQRLIEAKLKKRKHGKDRRAPGYELGYPQ